MTLELSIADLRTRDRELCLTLGQVYLELSPDFNRDYEAWNEATKTKLIESILIGRAINPIWTVINEKDNGTEEILDGQHRLTTALDFMHNKFKLKGKHFLEENSNEKWNGKQYNKLDIVDREKFRKYPFAVNALGPELRRDMNKLMSFYYLLNCSSVALNYYELMKPLYYYYYQLINMKKKYFLNLNFFRIKDCRGKLDCEIIDILMLSENIENSWSSIPQLRKKWLKKELGTDIKTINTYVKKNTKEIDNKLSFLVKIIGVLQAANAFEENKKLFKSKYTIYKFLLSRILGKCQTMALFNRHYKNIIIKFKDTIFLNDIQAQLGCENKNAIFQRKLLNKIDKILDEELDINNPANKRYFSKEMKIKKLKEQKYICPLCLKKINETGKYEGDHIKKWTAGGLTEPDNLQILHKRCHEEK